jgi:hypothetical protein
LAFIKETKIVVDWHGPETMESLTDLDGSYFIKCDVSKSADVKAMVAKKT